MQTTFPTGATRLLVALLLACVAGRLTAQDSAFVACAGTRVTLEAPDGYDYAWTPRTGLSSAIRQSASFTASANITYEVGFRRTIGNELVRNGDFERGNVDFTTDYRYVPSGTFDRGTYAVLSDPTRFNQGFSRCLDSETAGGQMLVADGSEIAGMKVWCQSVPVERGKQYAFRIFLTSLVSFNPPSLLFTINGRRLGAAQASISVCEWQQFYTTWEAPDVATAEICVVNNNTIAQGNDFALDRISFVEISDTIRRRYTVTVAQAARDTLDISLCPGERYRDNNLDLAPGESGSTVLRTSLGCDSTVHVFTTLRQPIFVSERADTLCPGDVFPFQGQALRRDTTICREGTTQFGCDSTYCLTVKFFDETALDVTIRPPSCVGDSDASLTLDVVAGRPPFTIQWEDGSTGTVRTGLPEGDYTVEVTDRLGCTARRTVRISDPPAIDVAGLSTVDAQCFAEPSGSVTATPTGGTGLLTLTVRDSVRLFDARFLAAGAYRLRASDSLGCFAERPFVIDSPPPVVLDLRGDTLLRLGQTASYRLNIAGDSVFTRWDFDLTSIDSLVRNNAVSFVPAGSGTVRVVGTDRNGCSTESSLALRVKSGERTYFPTAFSPNADGINDRFGPVLDPAIAEMRSFQVYDRWGGLVFSAVGCTLGDFASVCSWDGQAIGRGKAFDPGVYVYVARLRLIDGREIEQSGDFVLVR